MSHLENAHEFRKAFGFEDEPKKLDKLLMQWRLICEEYQEVGEAVFAYAIAENKQRTFSVPEMVDLLKELGDLVYVVYQMAAYLEFNLDEALERIHQSNMSKLHDGKVVKREDGKVLKGPNYAPPDLTGLIFHKPK